MSQENRENREYDKELNRWTDIIENRRGRIFQTKKRKQENWKIYIEERRTKEKGNTERVKKWECVNEGNELRTESTNEGNGRENVNGEYVRVWMGEMSKNANEGIGNTNGENEKVQMKEMRVRMEGMSESVNGEYESVSEWASVRMKEMRESENGGNVRK